MKNALIFLFILVGGTLIAANQDVTLHWTPSTEQFEDYMVVTGVVQIDGVEQTVATLEVGAFCDGECRGTIMVQYFPPTQRYVCQLPVYGNGGESFTFKLYDHEADAELSLDSPEALTFQENGYGRLADPYILNFTSVVTDVSQTVTLVEGWNWFSTYIDLGDPVALLDMLKEGLGENGVEIQSYDDNTEYYDGEWFGGLDESGITNDKTFLILVSNDCTFELEGPVVDPTTVSITLHNGWNWIGFPFDHEVEIAVAFADFDAEEGDVIQTCNDQTEFDGDEWFGDIETLLPGQGVMYFSNSAEPKQLVFVK